MERLAVVDTNYIQNKLKGHYPNKKFTGEALSELYSVCGGWSNDEFDKALFDFRHNDEKYQYCPDFRQLRKYGPVKQGNRQGREQTLWMIFYQSVELMGWQGAIDNTMNDNNDPELKAMLIRTGIKNMDKYECWPLLIRQYFYILHDDKDPAKACEYMELNSNNIEDREWWRKRKEYYELMGIDLARRMFSALRTG